MVSRLLQDGQTRIWSMGESDRDRGVITHRRASDALSTKLKIYHSKYNLDACINSEKKIDVEHLACDMCQE